MGSGCVGGRVRDRKGEKEFGEGEVPDGDGDAGEDEEVAVGECKGCYGVLADRWTRGFGKDVRQAVTDYRCVGVDEMDSISWRGGGGCVDVVEIDVVFFGGDRSS